MPTLQVSATRRPLAGKLVTQRSLWSPDGSRLAVTQHGPVEVFVSDPDEVPSALLDGRRSGQHASPAMVAGRTQDRDRASDSEVTRGAQALELESSETITYRRGRARNGAFQLRMVARQPARRVLRLAEGQSGDIWICDARTGTPRQTLSGPSWQNGLVWSSDGKLLVAPAPESVIAWNVTGNPLASQLWPFTEKQRFGVLARRQPAGVRVRNEVPGVGHRHRQQVHELAGPAERLAFSADGRRLSRWGRKRRAPLGPRLGQAGFGGPGAAGAGGGWPVVA